MGKLLNVVLVLIMEGFLVTQVGMYGLESDENRENRVDCVWVGNTTSMQANIQI